MLLLVINYFLGIRVYCILVVVVIVNGMVFLIFQLVYYFLYRSTAEFLDLNVI